ncbi:LTA synthase family protein [Noviherbaspirillum aridicola]|uniref:Sulfatase n=1 Tax=Noviherbaspirillum aridicola TaxID=2849687 RepID=A0ABQ4Q604_9BURK|nr:LTA synthase family protein [Noviherbaspirillum aridicola]GIZ52225.1 sulfatase [Noviherbaspirillum aridicola]
MRTAFSPLFRRVARCAGVFPLLMLSLFLAASLLTRIVLLLIARHEIGAAGLPAVLLLGAGRDLVTGCLAVLPAVLLHLLLPRARLAFWIRLPVVLATIYLLLFNLVSEILFWREFGVRYNFIAVDYLVYTQEVIGNIRESYPVGTILAALLLATLAFAWLLRRPLLRLLRAGDSLRARLLHAAAWSLAAIAAIAAVLGAPLLDTESLSNRYHAELANNGLYSFVSAFRNNELDYKHFYVTRPSASVRADLERLRAGPATIRRIAARPERRLNVVLVSVESLSAEFLGAFGNRKGLTPNLDRLAQDGMLFTRLYATGTRTVRGLEAISLALPPTPGQSIVKRPGNEDLYTLGSVFRGKGYDVRYVYGGYGYFDNMNAFFGGNGYQVVDRLSIPDNRIPFENIWGVADEALFDQALDEIDKSFRAGKPSFTHVMTTSNHRPYTYPEGRIDIPSKTGRAGGVKYTDYAIGRFMRMASEKPWFRDTVFLIVADHCASSAGKTELPVNRYHIPMIVYAPAHVAPRRVDRLASQMDVAPTLLGLLDAGHESRFLGRDILRMTEADERAFISNYQSLGYLRHGILTVLRPKRQVQAYRIADDSSATPTAVDPELLDEAIAYYQGAAELVRNGEYRAPR